MFVINPDTYSLPCYRIGPFRTQDISINSFLPDSDLIDDYFRKIFRDKKFIYTINGRKALNIALSSYNLNNDDIVTILTTTGNFYISGCVTKEIEKFCKWSREVVPETRLLLVNHEFGYPYKDLRKLKKYGFPIIEDCAGSFFSEDPEATIGRVGDFSIYSFPKMFPLQIGGLLVSNPSSDGNTDYKISHEELRYIKNVLSHYIIEKDSIIRERKYNYDFLLEKFESLGFTGKFETDHGVVPGVFMFRTDRYKLELPELKKYFWAHGIQCSVFYGEEAFFIPVHQALNEQGMLYFVEVMKSFMLKSGL